MGDGVQFAEDGLLGQRQYLDSASFVVEDGDGDGELDVGRTRAAAAFAGGVVAEFGGDVLGGGFVVEAEGLLAAVGGGAPALVELKGFVGEEGEADAAAVGELAGVQVTTAGAVVGDCGGGGFAEKGHVESVVWGFGRARVAHRVSM